MNYLTETPIKTGEAPLHKDHPNIICSVYKSGEESGKWSGTGSLPPIGSEVTTRMNGLGAGTVLGYLFEHGYLGVAVKLDNPPQWWIDQKIKNKQPKIALLFGRELI